MSVEGQDARRPGADAGEPGGGDHRLQGPAGKRESRIAVVVNGRAKNVTVEVISTLDQILLGGDLFVSRSLEEADEIAQVVVSRGYGTVLTGGGDGTFSVMVTKVFHEAERQGAELPRFGFLKLGTGNAIAHFVGASAAGAGGLAADMARLRQDAGSREVALIDVEGVLAPFCGFGMDAAILQDYEENRRRLDGGPLSRLGRGAAGYAVSSLTRSIPRQVMGRPPHCRVINRGGVAQRIGPNGIVPGSEVASGAILYEGPARLIAASTIPYYGYGLRAFPYATECTNRANLRVGNLGFVPLLRNFRSVWRGDFQDERRLIDFLIDRVEIQMHPPTPFQIGGDYDSVRAATTVGVASRPIRLVDFYAPPNAS